MSGVDWLNYNHVYYFWIVAQEGSIAAASRRLLVSPPAISEQIHDLENALGRKLFDRSGRGLSLTETGRVAYRYANDIFSLGRELVHAVRGGAAAHSIPVNIGVNDVLPKPVAFRLIEPLFRLPGRVRIACIQGTPAQLLPPLAAHELDVVLSDAPASPQIRIRAFSHLLGESGLTVFAAPHLARRLKRGFPRSLDGAPALLPMPGSALRIALDKWFESVRVRPEIKAQFEDVALLSVAGQHGHGFFAGYSVIAREIARGFRVQPVGPIRGYQGRFYAITVERLIRQPAIAAITAAARTRVFGTAKR